MLAVIINPQSNGGRTGKNWPALQAKLEARLGQVQPFMTGAPQDATRLTRQALCSGASHIIAIGGDGTIDEVVNGFFTEDGSGTLLDPQAHFSFIMKGTGGDFRRSFGFADDDEDAYIDRIAAGRTRLMDVGRLTYKDHNGANGVRYFNNICSFGMSGKVCVNVNTATWQKKLSGRFAFNWAVYTSLIGWRNKQVRICVDDVHDQVHAVQTAAICNGQFFGSGMRPAPQADMFDGVFDITIIADTNLVDVATSTSALRDGSAQEHPKVIALQGRKITATPVNEDDKIYIEADGETPGTLPATLDVLPAILPIRM